LAKGKRKKKFSEFERLGEGFDFKKEVRNLSSGWALTEGIIDNLTLKARVY